MYRQAFPKRFKKTGSEYGSIRRPPRERFRPRARQDSPDVARAIQLQAPQIDSRHRHGNRRHWNLPHGRTEPRDRPHGSPSVRLSEKSERPDESCVYEASGEVAAPKHRPPRGEEEAYPRDSDGSRRHSRGRGRRMVLRTQGRKGQHPTAREGLDRGPQQPRTCSCPLCVRLPPRLHRPRQGR